jgi:hypothetical protein
MWPPLHLARWSIRDWPCWTLDGLSNVCSCAHVRGSMRMRVSSQISDCCRSSCFHCHKHCRLHFRSHCRGSRCVRLSLWSPAECGGSQGQCRLRPIFTRARAHMHTRAYAHHDAHTCTHIHTTVITDTDGTGHRLSRKDQHVDRRPGNAHDARFAGLLQKVGRIGGHITTNHFVQSDDQSVLLGVKA